MHLILDICELNDIVKSKRMKNYANQPNMHQKMLIEDRVSEIIKKRKKETIDRYIFDTNNAQTTNKNWKIFAPSASMLIDNLFLFSVALYAHYSHSRHWFCFYIYFVQSNQSHSSIEIISRFKLKLFSFRSVVVSDFGGIIMK